MLKGKSRKNVNIDSTDIWSFWNMKTKRGCSYAYICGKTVVEKDKKNI